MSFSLKEVASGGGKHLSEGQHLVKYRSIEAGLSSTNKPKLTFKGADAESKTEFEYHRSLQPNALWKLKEDLLSAGVSEDHNFLNSPLENPAGFAREIMGIFCGGALFNIAVEVSDSTYNGKPTKNHEYIVLGKYGATGEYDDV